MTTKLSPHTVHRFDEELDEIARLVDGMGEFAVKQLRRAVKSLKKEDPSGAHRVIERDRGLNELDVEIDEKIMQLLAKRAPVAGDLRRIVAVGKVVTDLERSGDEARKIARLCLRFYESGQQPPSEEILRGIYSMAKFAGAMLDSAMGAFSSLDVARAHGVLLMDEDLEARFDSLLRQLTTFVMEDARNVGHFVDIVLGIRALERYGGHAKNVAGHVIFLATGNDVRHLDADAVGEFLGMHEE